MNFWNFFHIGQTQDALAHTQDFFALALKMPEKRNFPHSRAWVLAPNNTINGNFMPYSSKKLWFFKICFTSVRPRPLLLTLKNFWLWLVYRPVTYKTFRWISLYIFFRIVFIIVVKWAKGCSLRTVPLQFILLCSPTRSHKYSFKLHRKNLLRLKQNIE